MGWNAHRDGRRKYAYGLPGKRATLRSAFGSEIRGSYSLLGACSLEGMSLDACELVNTTDNAIDGPRFLKWVEEKLVRLLICVKRNGHHGSFFFLRCPLLQVPIIRPFPAKNSVVIADNCSFHHCDEFVRLIEAAGGRVLYLSAYRQVTRVVACAS
jgi:hypothetical protein